MKNFGFIFIAIILTVIFIAVTFTVAVEFSAFAAGMAKAVLAVALFAAFDKFVLKEIDTVAELKAGNTAYAIFLLAMALLFSINTATAQQIDTSQTPEHIDIALSQVGLTEQGDNEGPLVAMYCGAVGLTDGYAWCACFAGWTLKASGARSPDIRSAGARKYITSNSIRANEVLRGTVEAPDYGLAIWQRGNSWAGHIGFIASWDEERNSGITIEGNTSPGAGRPQRDGDGVYVKQRSIQPGNYFRITHFTPVLL